MNRVTAIHCILHERYKEAADYVKGFLIREKIQTKLTVEQIAEILGKKYLRIKNVDNGLTLQEKADQVLHDTLFELMPPKPSRGSLSELLKDD